MSGSELLLKYQVMAVPVTNDCDGPKPCRDDPLPSPFLGVHRNSICSDSQEGPEEPPTTLHQLTTLPWSMLPVSATYIFTITLRSRS